MMCLVELPDGWAVWAVCSTEKSAGRGQAVWFLRRDMRFQVGIGALIFVGYVVVSFVKWLWGEFAQ